MESLTEVHDSLMRRMQLVERKVSLISIQVGQIADAIYRMSNKDANTDYFRELSADAKPVPRPKEPVAPVGQGPK